MIVIDGVRCFQAMVPMRDGVRLNTFVYLPDSPRGAAPVILERTPYGISAPAGRDITDPTKGWTPDPEQPMLGSLMRGWRAITQHGYCAVYQDCRGRYGSEGVDTIYAADADDGYDTLDWIAGQPWSNQRVGVSGSSGAATTALAAASSGHPTVQALWEQVGASNIYHDVVYEGGSVELERLWLWVATNIPGLSASHRDHVQRTLGLSAAQFDTHAQSAAVRQGKLAASAAELDKPYVGSPEWMRLPLTGHPDFSVLQPQLDELLRHPLPDTFREAHNYRSRITVPGFHVTTWFDVFRSGVIAAFQELRQRIGNQHLWIGPNAHFQVYDRHFLPTDPYFEWFDHWLKDTPSAIIDEQAVYYSPKAWVDPQTDEPNTWVRSRQWPPANSSPFTLHLRGDGTLGGAPAGEPRSFTYDPMYPVTTNGGRNLLITSGMRDQRPVQSHPDYGLIYLSEPLTKDVTLAGPVSARVHLSSDRPDTDLVVKLIDHYPDGRAMLVLDGICRVMTRSGAPQHLVPGVPVEVPVRLGDIAHTFAAGHRIEVDVTSSNFPRYARNTNSGHLALADGADVYIAHNTIHHAAATPSAILLYGLDDL